MASADGVDLTVSGAAGVVVPMPALPLGGKMFCAHAVATPPTTSSGIINDRHPRPFLSLESMLGLLAVVVQRSVNRSRQLNHPSPPHDTSPHRAGSAQQEPLWRTRGATNRVNSTAGPGTQELR